MPPSPPLKIGVIDVLALVMLAALAAVVPPWPVPEIHEAISVTAESPAMLTDRRLISSVPLATSFGHGPLAANLVTADTEAETGR